MLQSMPQRAADASSATVAVVGLGKIGLPLAVQFAGKGMTVIGCDVQPAVVETVNAGRSHIHEEPGLEAAVADAVRAHRLSATTDTAAAAVKASVVVVIVPLLVAPGGAIDFHSLDAATEAVGRGLQKGTLVIFETTLPVGTTRHRLGPRLEQVSGLRAGDDFWLAFSPERLYAGRIFEDLRQYPKIVGGIDKASTERAVRFYRSVLDAEVRAVENAETAEFAKLAETAYRDVNIALANQLALYGSDRMVNVGEAFASANSQPFSHLHRPGVGVGGHCIPVYPYFLLSDARDGELSMIGEGRRTNDAMAKVGVDRLARTLHGLAGRRVLVLGAAYREDVKELAFSTAFPIVALLKNAGAEVMIHDPLFTAAELGALPARFVEPDSQEALSADAVIVQAWHASYRALDWRRFDHLVAVFDGRGAVDPAPVRAAGAVYQAIGTPEAEEAPQA